MPDDYQIPAVVLIAALMLAFAYLHRRFRSVRTLLWIFALGCAELQAILLWIVDHRSGSLGGPLSAESIWVRASGDSALVLSSVLFLASLSPLTFKVGRIRLLYAIPYLIPLLLYSILYSGLSPWLAIRSANSATGVAGTSGIFLWAYALLAVWAVGVALVWSLQKGVIPIWLATAIVVIGSALCLPSFLHGDVYWPLLVVISGNMLMTALLVVYHRRRASPGVLFAVTGFAAWALMPFLSFSAILRIPGAAFLAATHHTTFAAALIFLVARAVILGKVLVAMGLILLVLEDQIQKNQTAQEREHRIRMELESYSRQALTARSVEEFDRECTQLCAMISEHSVFDAVAIIVRSAGGGFSLVGYFGLDGAVAGALDAVTRRLPISSIATGTEALTESLISESASINLDLTPWLTPGDDLERLHMTRVGAIPMLGPDNTVEGAILLSNPRVPLETLRADDLLPLEILARRLQAARTQAMMLGKLIESERFAGVGQLATNVAQQLNNPLTVILGYSALLEDAASTGRSFSSPDVRPAEAITLEARRMKGILERLSRFSRLSSERFNSFSVADMLADIEQLHRTDFLRHSIEFRLTISTGLPAIFGNAHQIRQALLHATQFAIESVLKVEASHEKSIRVEATPEEGRVRIGISHSGQSFPHPERAFETLSAGLSNTENATIGLNLCAAIIQEHRGSITALNLQPTGAAIQIELPIS